MIVRLVRRSESPERTQETCIHHHLAARENAEFRHPWFIPMNREMSDTSGLPRSSRSLTFDCIGSHTRSLI